MLSFLFPKRNPQRADTAFSSLHESRTTIVSRSVTMLNFLYNYVCFHSHTLPPQPRSMPFPPTLVMSVQLPRRPAFCIPFPSYHMETTLAIFLCFGPHPRQSWSRAEHAQFFSVPLVKSSVSAIRGQATFQNPLSLPTSHTPSPAP